MALNLGTLNIDIKANTTDATNRLDTVKSSAQDLEKHSKITLNVDADTSSVNKKLDETSAKIDELDGKSAGGAFNFTANLTDNVSGTLDSITNKTSGYKLTGLEGAISSLNALISGDGDGSIIKAFSSLAGSTGLSAAISGITAYLTGKGLFGAGSNSIATHIAQLAGTHIPSIGAAFSSLAGPAVIGKAVLDITDYLTGNGVSGSVKTAIDTLKVDFDELKSKTKIFDYDGMITMRNEWVIGATEGIDAVMAKLDEVSQKYDNIGTAAQKAGWSTEDYQWFSVMSPFIEMSDETAVQVSAKMAAAMNDPEKAKGLTAAGLVKGDSNFENLIRLISYTNGNFTDWDSRYSFLSQFFEGEMVSKMMPWVMADSATLAGLEGTLAAGGAFRTTDEIQKQMTIQDQKDIFDALGVAFDEVVADYVADETLSVWEAKNTEQTAYNSYFKAGMDYGWDSPEALAAKDLYEKSHIERLAKEVELRAKIAEITEKQADINAENITDESYLDMMTAYQLYLDNPNSETYQNWKTKTTAYNNEVTKSTSYNGTDILDNVYANPEESKGTIASILSYLSGEEDTSRLDWFTENIPEDGQYTVTQLEQLGKMLELYNAYGLGNISDAEWEEWKSNLDWISEEPMSLEDQVTASSPFQDYYNDSNSVSRFLGMLDTGWLTQMMAGMFDSGIIADVMNAANLAGIDIDSITDPEILDEIKITIADYIAGDTTEELFKTYMFDTFNALNNTGWDEKTFEQIENKITYESGSIQNTYDSGSIYIEKQENFYRTYVGDGTGFVNGIDDSNH